MKNQYGEMTNHSKYQQHAQTKRGSGGTRAMIFKNPIRVASGYGARSHFKEIITINVNKTKNYIDVYCKARKWLVFPTPHLFDAPAWGEPDRISG